MPDSKYFLFLSALCFLSACAAAPAMPSVEVEKRTLAVGQLEAIDLDFDPKPEPAMSEPWILRVDIAEGSRKVLVAPMKVGFTTLTLAEKGGKRARKFAYTSISADMLEHLTHIRELLQKIDGVSIEVKGYRIVIEGALKNPATVLQDYDRLLKVQSAFPTYAVNLVTLAPELYEASARLMEAEMHELGMDVGVRVENTTFVLSGKVNSAAQRDHAEMIAQNYLPPVMASKAIQEGALLQGARKYSIRNLLTVAKLPAK
jgi:hypothetical protein